MKHYKPLLALILTASLLFAAATHTGDWVLSGGRLSFGTGGIFQLPNGTTPPGTCGVADLFFDTDATAGQNLFGCTSTNTFTQLSGASSGSSLVFSCVIGSDSTTSSLTIAEMATPKTCTIPASTLAVGDYCRVESQFTFTDDADTSGTWVAYPTLNGTATGDALLSTAAQANGEVFLQTWASFSVDSTTVAEFEGQGRTEDDNFGANLHVFGTRDIATGSDILIRFMGLVSDTGDVVTFKYGAVQCWTSD